ncbi:YicC family protein [Lutimonas saemankumensis]|uniref:YicC/YloC family endoribonuclease n=1 Tax=Lutimonas saemankumensis TaxID=483016 RepID=UPI001CD4B28A|nr:YicC/YloC family endoribonuclease [Lutimonas saemankumensis]MCA0932912.1 YicC family protein [Lutimonas saemankumensis]
MIQSMTGYGKSIIQLDSKKISLELKSLNSKNLDINARFPGIYKEKEIEVRKLLANRLVRGKIDMSFYIETTAEETSTKINKGIVSGYIEQLEEIHKEADILAIAMRLPDVLKTEREELDPQEWMEIEKGIEEAVNALQEYRVSEGNELKNDFESRINVLKTKLKEVIDLDGDRLDQVRLRLNKSIKELEQNVDENRFEQELIYYLEKLDITEEKVRLTNHLDYFLKELEVKVSNGKKLGFISQEIGREINTIGSKANFAPMQKVVVEMKDELEKIKEQLLNVL